MNPKTRRYPCRERSESSRVESSRVEPPEGGKGEELSIQYGIIHTRTVLVLLQFIRMFRSEVEYNYITKSLKKKTQHTSIYITHICIIRRKRKRQWISRSRFDSYGRQTYYRDVARRLDVFLPSAFSLSLLYSLSLSLSLFPLYFFLHVEQHRKKNNASLTRTGWRTCIFFSAVAAKPTTTVFSPCTLMSSSSHLVVPAAAAAAAAAVRIRRGVFLQLHLRPPRLFPPHLRHAPRHFDLPRALQRERRKVMCHHVHP